MAVKSKEMKRFRRLDTINEEYTEEEFQALAMQIQYLYDDELIANKTENQYLEDLRWDVDQMKEQETAEAAE